MSWTFVGIDDKGRLNAAAETAIKELIPAPPAAATPVATPSAAQPATQPTQVTQVTQVVQATQPVGRRISYPSYWPHSYWQEDPASDIWARVMDDPRQTGIVLVNPDSGPGATKQQDWVIQSQVIRQSGASVSGYVSTNYADKGPARTVGSRGHDKILSEIQQHIDWYGVTGVFLDEVSNGWNDAQKNDHVWYGELVKKIRAKHGEGFTIIGNCGTVCREEYLPLFDVVVTYESDAAKYVSTPVKDLHPQVFRRYGHGKFWHMVHDVTSQPQARQVLNRAGEIGVHHLYITDGTNAHTPPALWGNPYGAPPAGWLHMMQRAWARYETY